MKNNYDDEIKESILKMNLENEYLINNIDELIENKIHLYMINHKLDSNYDKINFNNDYIKFDLLNKDQKIEEKNKLLRILKNDIYYSDIIDELRNNFYDIIVKYFDEEKDQINISDFVNELKIEINN